MTKEQILQATGDELSVLAGEVLQPETVKCRPFKTTSYSGSGVTVYQCESCGVQLYLESGFLDGKCTAFKPIPLTWPEAMKWRDWAADKFGGKAIRDAMKIVCDAATITYFDIWPFTPACKPEHYIKAACLCKLEKE